MTAESISSPYVSVGSSPSNEQEDWPSDRSGLGRPAYRARRPRAKVTPGESEVSKIVDGPE